MVDIFPISWYTLLFDDEDQGGQPIESAHVAEIFHNWQLCRK